MSDESFVASLSDSEISDYWRLCDEFTVSQAAFLVVGIDPSSETGTLCESWKTHERPAGYEATKQAISAALRKGSIAGNNVAVPELDWNGNHVDDYPNSTHIEKSVVDRDSLTLWLRSRGIMSSFFFPVGKTDSPNYLDPSSKRFAPKLAASVKAWQAMEDENLTRGKSPLQALETWLESRYKELGLVHLTDNEKNKTKSGDINKSAVSEAAKVANWLPTGGVPKTPGG